MKVVLDTNVLIAAFITHGVCHELLEHCAINHEIILSAFILGEVRDKRVGKFNLSNREAESVIRLLKSRAVVVKPRALEQPTCRDPDDDHILATAIAGNCECIVTGDKDLLELEPFEGIRMVAPSNSWAAEK